MPTKTLYICAAALCTLAALLAAGCASYSEPAAGEAAATVLGKVERRGKGMGWYRQTFVAEVDGAAIAPAGIQRATVPVRVRPGRHTMVFTVGFRHGGSDELDCPCLATFRTEVELLAGQRVALDSSVEPGGQARLRLIDKATGRPLLPEMQAEAKSVRQR